MEKSARGRFRRVPRWYQENRGRPITVEAGGYLRSVFLASIPPSRSGWNSRRPAAGPRSRRSSPRSARRRVRSSCAGGEHLPSGFPSLLPVGALRGPSQGWPQASNRFRVTLPDHAVVDVKPSTGQPGARSSLDSPDSNRARTSLSISIGPGPGRRRGQCVRAPRIPGLRRTAPVYTSLQLVPDQMGRASYGLQRRDSDPAVGYCLAARACARSGLLRRCLRARVTEVTVSSDGRRASGWARRTVLGSGLLAIAAAVAACGGGRRRRSRRLSRRLARPPWRRTMARAFSQRRDIPPEAVLAQFELGLVGADPSEDPMMRGGATIGRPRNTVCRQPGRLPARIGAGDPPLLGRSGR